MSSDRLTRRAPPLLTRELLSAMPRFHQDLAPRERELLLAEEELDQSLAQIIGTAPVTGEIWVFAYGSLIWNPIFPVAAAVPAIIYGHHRSLCMNSIRGRGSISKPGAMLALDAGGACKGIAMKVGGDLPMELKLLWRREMMSGAYTPKWVSAKTGGGAIQALGFIANRASPHYAGRLNEDELTRRLATAVGVWGSNLDYVQRTYEGLRSHGIRDIALERLLDRQTLLEPHA